MPRCSCKTLKKLRCKNAVCALGQCWSHLNQKYYEKICTIQRIWKGYKTRKIYNTIFIRLPQELQHKIVFYIRQNYLVKKHHYDVIQKIMTKKIENTLKIIRPDRPIENIVNLTELYNLCNKYFMILSSEDTEKLQQNSDNYLYIFRRIAFTDEVIETVMFLQHQLANFTERVKSFEVF